MTGLIRIGPIFFSIFNLYLKTVKGTKILYFPWVY